MKPDQGAICVSLCESTAADLSRAMQDAKQLGELVELRLDCLGEGASKLDLNRIGRLIEDSSLPAIITFRPTDQGGFTDINTEARSAFWTDAGFKLPAALFDLEIDLVEHFAKSGQASSQTDWARIICSYHDSSGAPADFEQMYERLASTPAEVLKLAVSVTDATECLSLFKLLARAGDENRQMIAIGMGPAGLVTRILGPSRGAFLTYGGLAGKSTAAGQISAQQLRSLYRINEIDDATEITGLLGTPITHSLSSYVHNAAIVASSRNAVYIPFDVRDSDSFLKRMIHPRTRELKWNFRGLSVTAPHKITVLDRLDWIDLDAREIGAVNTVVVDGDILRGYNTDAEALVQPLLKRVGSLKNARVAVIGAGGVARAALHKLRHHGANATVFARDTNKGAAATKDLGASCKALSEADFRGFDVVINATPLGSRGFSERVSPATSRQLRGARLVYDLVYNPTETSFLYEAKGAGCDTLDGLSMFLAQAEAQFQLWTGNGAPPGVMEEAARQALQEADAEQTAGCKQ